VKSCFFFRLLSHEDKGAALAAAVAAVRNGGTVAGVVHAVDPAFFRQVPGSPFAYWVSDQIRSVFVTIPALREHEGFHACVTNPAGDDRRYFRCSWEVPPDLHGRAKRWVPLVKGGKFSPFYCDVHLMVDWDPARSTYRGFLGTPHRPLSKPASIDHFFRPGLTWPRRTNGLSFRVMPTGCIFADKGPAIFAAGDRPESLLALSALVNSRPFVYFVGIQLARTELAQSFEVGLIQRTPLPEVSAENERVLANLAYRSWRYRRDLDTRKETSHAFTFPALLFSQEQSLRQRAASWLSFVAEAERQLATIQDQIDDAAFHLYPIPDEDRKFIEEGFGEVANTEVSVTDEGDEQEEGSEDEKSSLDVETITVDLLSWCVGVAFGRWNVRLVGSGRTAPSLDPFAPLTACSPAELVGPDGLPAREVPSGYPLRISWDGILVDDSGFENGSPHQSDIVCRAQEVLAFLWGNRAEAIEQEACEILGVKSLRDYFRKPGGLFADHLKQYSKSRRQAPIYWPVSTASGSYTLWIYYHRLNEDLLYKAVNEYVNPKISETDRRIAQLEGDLGSASGGQATVLRGKLEEAKAFRGELEDFKAELLRVGGLPYKPDLNDGVLITASPLWKLFRLPKWRKDLEGCWKKLEAGEYDWAHLAYAIWPDRVKEVCIRDRSIAMAHDLEELYKGDAPTSAEKPRRARKT
jgi:hypothetical protein